MYWYIKLSRCGIVLNRNIPLGKVDEIDDSLYQFQINQYNKFDDELRKQTKEILKSNRFLALGMAKHRYDRQGKNDRSRSELLEKVERLFE